MQLSQDYKDTNGDELFIISSVYRQIVAVFDIKDNS